MVGQSDSGHVPSVFYSFISLLAANPCLSVIAVGVKNKETREQAR
jgi:hypothetical protein